MQRNDNLFPEQIENWLKRVHTESGFISCLTGGGDNESSLEREKMWEFRIAVLPNRENLIRAAHALAQVFSKFENHKIDFKILAIASDREFSMSIWDGTLTDGKSDSDRDQRGKEICVYMSYDDLVSKQYIRTPEQWKEIMLQCWRALQDAGVEGIGYMCCPTGDMTVRTEIGLMCPFTYTSFKPYKGKHGILNQTNYNPYGHLDPLEGVCITRSDLIKHGIDVRDSYNILHARRAYLKNHLQASEASLARSVNELNVLLEKSSSDNVSPVDALAMLCAQLKNELTSGGKISDELMAKIGVLLPRMADPNLSSQALIGELKFYIEKFNKNESRDSIRDAFNQAIDRLDQYIATERPIQLGEIVNELMQNDNFMKIAKHLNMDEARVRLLVDRFPGEMQLVYRRSVHLQREFNAFAKIESQHYPHPAVLRLFDMIADDAFWKVECHSKKLPNVVSKLSGIIALSDVKSESVDGYQRLFDQLKKAAILCKSEEGKKFFSSKTIKQPLSTLYAIFQEVNEIDKLQDSVRFNELCSCYDRRLTSSSMAAMLK